jgi:two-component system cell cycle response regulator
MPTTLDPRLAELKLLEHVANRIWPHGIFVGPEVGQAAAVGIPQDLYADLIITLWEDGYLFSKATEAADIRRNLNRGDRFSRDSAVQQLQLLKTYCEITVTYRGLRRIDELRDLLRRDRVLDRSGILLDGRYLISDLIYFLERVDGGPVSVLFADVDDFKQFNSNHGYQAGDAVLRQVFRLIRRSVGDRGEVYRRGGEEIVAVLPYCGLEQSGPLAESIRQQVEAEPVIHAGEELRVTLSIGIAASPPYDPDGPALEAQAGNAVGRAKAAGKNRVIVA